MARPRPQVAGLLSALPTRFPSSRAASSSHPRGASLRRDDVSPALPVGLKAINEQSHHRSPSHYNAALRLAADYTFRRGQTALLRTGPDVESLGWSIARAVCADAERAGIDLGRDGLEQLLRVSPPPSHSSPSVLLCPARNPAHIAARACRDRATAIRLRDSGPPGHRVNQSRTTPPRPARDV